ncbi:hypothetical protein B0H13DRAFT_1888709 [Mycena leptocephala]|nr:hypothetical protein B0H13DRAFT_1888709 [Mycena leptocephala]
MRGTFPFIRRSRRLLSNTLQMGLRKHLILVEYWPDSVFLFIIDSVFSDSTIQFIASIEFHTTTSCWDPGSRRPPNSQSPPAPSLNESAQPPRARSTRSTSLNTNQPQRAPPEPLQPTTAQSRSGSDQQLRLTVTTKRNYKYGFHSIVSDPTQPVVLLSEGQPPGRTGAAHLPAITETDSPAQRPGVESPPITPSNQPPPPTPGRAVAGRLAARFTGQTTFATPGPCLHVPSADSDSSDSDEHPVRRPAAHRTTTAARAPSSNVFTLNSDEEELDEPPAYRWGRLCVAGTPNLPSKCQVR